MAKIKLGLWAGILVLVASGLVAGDTRSAARDRVCFEAEQAQSITPYFSKRTTPYTDPRHRSSSGGYLEIPEGVHQAKGHRRGETYYPGVVTYQVNIPSAGTYTFWARSLWVFGTDDDCGGNTFWVKIGDQADQLFGVDGTYLVWAWRKLKQPVRLSAGIVTILLKNHQDGPMIDQIFLTRSTFVPVGPMPVTPGALVPLKPDDKSKASR
jgi:hypothetical protein